MPSLIDIVFGNKDLAISICKYLSYREILSLNIKYKNIIYIIYNELYIELARSLHISSEDIHILSQKTNELLCQYYKYPLPIHYPFKINRKYNLSCPIFPKEEKIIREIIFKYAVDPNAIEPNAIESNAIYCILYNAQSYALLARCIHDKIIAYPTENSSLNITPLNYAIKEKKYNMIKQILYDFDCHHVRTGRKFIMILNTILNNNDFESFQIITNYIYKHYLISILSTSSIFINSIMCDLTLMREYYMLDWTWTAKNGRPFCIDDIDIIMKENIENMSFREIDCFEISPDMEEFLNEKFDLICHFIDLNFEQFKYFNNIIQHLNKRSDFNMSKLNYNNHIKLLNKNYNESFMLIYIFATYIKKFDINWVYGDSGTLLEMVTNYIIDSHTPALFIENEQPGRKIRFTNAILIYKYIKMHS